MMPKTGFLRRFTSRLALGVLALAAAPVLAQSLPARIQIATGNPQALAAATDAGVMPSSQRVSLTLTLTPDSARAAALDQFLAALATPSSPSYHQWLTPAQFAATYGATADQLAAASAWAQTAGLTLDATSAGGTRITVSGSAARVQTAFATSLHLYQLNAQMYYANATQPSLPAAAAPLFSAIEGLDNLPASTVFQGSSFTSLAALIDANATAILPLAGTTAVSAEQLPEYTLLLRQAAAQGITTLLPAAAGAFADATALANASTLSATLPRPTWQSAPGLPADRFRATPDIAATSLAALTQTLTTIAGSGRLGNVAPVLYKLGPVAGLFTQPDAAPAGTWESATGLGLVNLEDLAKAYPRGTGSSFTSFAATNYAPTHGQSTSFTSVVTSGTGGPTPTGTVQFLTSNGTNLGTVTLVNGTATLTLSNLDSGTYILQATYSGDATYASSQSPTAQIYVAPEPSQLAAAVTGSPTVGSNFTVTVTDSATLGAPSGAITLTISGTSTSLTQTLTPASATSSTATFSVPSPAPGGITLSINCTSTTNYSCQNPLTTNVQIAKATPVLSISFTPNPPVSGQQIALNAVVSTVGSAPAPTGNVRFFDNGTLLNASALSGGTTSTTGSVPSTATHSITSTYDGDSNYNSVSTAAGSMTSGTITTSTVLTSSATSVNAGANITFTARITPASTGPASPSGTVQFFDGGTSLGTANLSANTASITVNTLSSATSHSITAVYSGDGYYSTSTSGPVTLTAGTASNATTTTLTASTTIPVHGSSVLFTANVVPAGGSTTPTGTVTFTSQSGQLGVSTLVNGFATFSTNLLPGGVSTVIASYNPVTPFNSSASAALTISVSPEPVTLAFALPASPTFGTALQATVTVTGASGVAYPTGLVIVQPSGSGYTTASSASVTSSGSNSTGSATVTIQTTAAGSVILTATYAGDKNFAAAGPISTSITIARAASTTALSFTPTPPVPGQPLTLTAKVTFASSTGPTGTVQFKDGGTVLGTGTLDATGTASFSTTLSAGNHTLSAVYSGDTNYLPGTSPSTNTSTGTNVTSTTLTLSPPIVASGSLETLTATVGPTVNGLAPTGTVQFVSAGNVLCTALLNAASAACPYTPSVVGTQAIVASYLGDGNYAASSSPAANLSVTVPVGSLAATVSPANVQGNTSATVTATVTAPAGTVPTGSVSATILSATGVTQSTYTTPLPGTGTGNMATISIPVVAPTANGSYTISVACVNTNFSCPSVNLPFTVGPVGNGSATLTAVITPATAQPASAATVTGTITAPAGTILNGTVTATIAGVSGAVYTVTLPGTAVTTGTYSIPITVPATPGVYTVTVTCNSTAFTCNPATASLTSSTTVLIATTTKLVATLSGIATGATVFTATVTPTSVGAAAPTGTVTILDGATPIGTGVVGSNGTFTISLTQNLTVTHSYTALYSGDTLYAASASPAITGTGASTPAVITLTANTTSALSGQNVILTAQVTGLTAVGTAPTGTVSFYVVGASARLLGTVQLSSAGTGVAVAVLTTTGLPSGTITIDAVYSGDTNFTTVTSNIITLGTTDFSVTFNPPTLTVNRGGSGSAITTVNFLGGLTGSVTLGCTPAPASYVTCSFSPATLNGTGISTLTVGTAAPRAALAPPVRLRNGILGGGAFAALLCLLLPAGKRRRLPTRLLLMLVSAGLLSGLGCSQNNFASPLTSSGSPLGTTILTITTAGSDGTNTIHHTYYYQVTIQ